MVRTSMVKRSDGYPVDPGLGDSRELEVCGLLLLEGLLEHRGAVAPAELAGPGCERPVPGNFVVLDRLRSSQGSGIEDLGITGVAHDLIGLGDDAVDGGAVHCLGRVAV